MDTLTKSMQGNTKPLGMTGTVPGIENLPTNFGGAKPMDAMSMMAMGRGLDPAMNRTQMDPYAMGPMGPLSDPYNTKSSYMPPGTNFNPMSSRQDAGTYAVGKYAADAVAADEEKAKIAEEAKRKLLSERLDAESKKSQGLLYQGLDFSPIKVRGGSRGR
jgi:hypothetical protein